MFFKVGLYEMFWVEAITITTYLQNRILTFSIGDITFEELWKGIKPISHLKVFGSEVHNQVSKEKIKLDSKIIKDESTLRSLTKLFTN
jgi:hypothetical protein